MSSISLLRPDEVPDELICAICFSIPLKPKLLSCEHVFCANCIRRALETQTSCPTCRTICNESNVRNLCANPFAFRIWNSVQVKCDQSESGCAWTGSISDLESHQQNCSAGNRMSINREELERLRQENIRLKEENEHLKVAMKEAKKESLVETATNLIMNLKKEFDLLEKIDHSSYNFYRYNVVDLAQLISRNLMDKPGEIDSNRIYNCVHRCYRALENGYSDNPSHYHLDVSMLLTTCAASNWFSDKQHENIISWIGACSSNFF
ncbi:hypothetical protein CTEN210_10355 [Chaetoceros tenuissimus]|uniref:RING-type domain-containing protein n=1 Tax=Chaetoceros tenuissimus TaxID=426638 RepID=A0AAD3D0H9_9STRA|nr:hypothetical protein CTEN210_10355 [Chaetoceros tenuissimus]